MYNVWLCDSLLGPIADAYSRNKRWWSVGNLLSEAFLVLIDCE